MAIDGEKRRPLDLRCPIAPQPIAIDRRLREAVKTAWRRDLREEANEYVVNKPPAAILRFGDFIFLINNLPKPYVSEEYRKNQAAAEFRELRQLKVVMEHGAFFTVDLMHPKKADRKTKAAAYRHMCSFAAEFADENCMGVSFPETGQFVPWDQKVRSALKTDEPLKSVCECREIPVIGAREGDSALQSATAQARSRWSEFVMAFGSRRSEQLFSVKAPFRDGECVEWIWVATTDITEDIVEGTLDNAPVNLKNVREGERVRVPVSAISDWLYTDGSRVVGGFSLNALQPSDRR